MLVSGGVDRVLTLYNVTLISDCVDVGEWGRRLCVLTLYNVILISDCVDVGEWGRVC